MRTRTRDAFLHALAIFPAVLGQSQEGVWERLNTQAMDLHRQKHDAEVLPIAQQALAMAEQKFPAASSKLAVALTNVAEIYRALARYPEAEVHYRRALEIYEKAPEPVEEQRIGQSRGAL